MDIIDKLRNDLALQTANWLANRVEKYDLLDYLKEYKQKLDLARGRPVEEYIKEDFVSFFEYAFKAVYGETSKVAIIFLIAYLLHMLIPVIVITIIFASIRLVAGGTHMDSYLKCLVTTSLIFSLGSIITLVMNTIQFDKSYLYLMIGFTYLISIILAWLYAPRDTATKRITDPISIKKRKTLSVIVISLISITIYIKYIDNQLIFISSCVGMLLEMFSLTPIAQRITDIFYRFDNEGRDF